MDQAKDMIEAVKAGDTDRVRWLLEADPALANAKTSLGESAILLAAYYRHKEIAELLLAGGADLDIFEASAVGQYPTVVRALDGQPDLIDTYSHDGFTPLGLASFFGHTDIVKLLLARGAEVNAASHNPMRVQPLHSAVAGQHLAIAEALLDRGADVNAVQTDEFTPLHGAAQNGQREMVELLLSRGADVNPRATGGRTPLAFALEEGHSDVANLLRQHSGTM